MARIAVMGLGHVGQALLRALPRLGLEVELVLAVDGRGAFVGSGLDPTQVVTRKAARDYDALRSEGDVAGWLEAVRPDVWLELTPTNLDDGQPARGHVLAALQAGAAVITAAKSHQASPAITREVLAAAAGGVFWDHPAILGGVPATEWLAGVGLEVREVEGVLNGTTNYMIQRLGEGVSFEDALDEAVAKGLAERDWRYDLEGDDVAVKLIGLARHLTGEVLGRDAVEVVGDPALGLSRGISGATPALLQALRERGQTLRLVGALELTPEGARGWVGPRALALSDPLANVAGATNALQLRGLMNDTPMELFVQGPGAGADPTASRVLGNLKHWLVTRRGS